MLESQDSRKIIASSVWRKLFKTHKNIKCCQHLIVFRNLATAHVQVPCHLTCVCT